MSNKTVFAGYPSAMVYQNPDGKKTVQHLLWGDWMRLKQGQSGDYYEVRARGQDGWIHKDDIQEERLLEIVFVDIGQGDGTLLVTPDDKHMLIDAGVGDNMARFLNWRYNGFKEPWEFQSAVISHSDADHYGGFDELFKIPNVHFKTIYHNGIVERGSNKEKLGPKAKIGHYSYLTDIVKTHDHLKRLVTDPANWQKRRYCRLLKTAIDNGACSNFKMLGSNDGYMPGYEEDRSLTIKVLGPVVEKDEQERPLLRWFENSGKTKNGHSVVLRLQYRNISLLLGGDLNIPSEELLLCYHTGLPWPSKSDDHYEEFVEAARGIFQVDLAKSCHHGSADFSSTFLTSLFPIATIISSGDNESHSHPRADTLGTIGRYSRGARPLIFSTELARSAKETIKHPNVLKKHFRDIKRQIEKLVNDGSTEFKKKKEALNKEYEELLNNIERSIAVFGAINVRTDGRNVVVAQKLETPRRSGGKTIKWDIYCLESQDKGPLIYQSKYLQQHK